jgi:hypothetical protein
VDQPLLHTYAIRIDPAFLDGKSASAMLFYLVRRDNRFYEEIS